MLTKNSGEQLLTMEKEFQEIDSKSSWSVIYQQIRHDSSNFNYASKDARRIENKNLNRYRDVNPYDHSRVKLVRGDKDYINASLVKVPAASRAYILTQGPLPATTGHFWLMVWEQKSKAVLMLNRIIEKNTVKCHQYWPLGKDHGGDDELICTDVSLKITYLGEKEAQNFTTRELLLTDTESGQTRVIWHFHYTSWPDFGVPESPAAFLNFLMTVRESGALEVDVGPPVVHCSAGIGRSGTFCLVDSCLVLIEASGDMNSVRVQEILLDMRRYRMGLIQTPDQLRFSYLAIIEGAKYVLGVGRSVIGVPSNSNLNSEGGCLNAKQPDGDRETESSELEEESDRSEVAEVECDSVNEAASEKSRGKYVNDSDPPPLPPRSKHCEDGLSDLLTPSIDASGENHEMQLLRSGNNESNSLNCKSGIYEESSPSQPFANAADASTNKTLNAEIRKRQRKERLEKTAQTVQRIRQRQQESEAWSRRRSKRQKVGNSVDRHIKRLKK